MCGIIVHLSKVQNAQIEHKLQLSLKSLNHRGPDAEGVFKDKNVCNSSSILLFL